jgi:diguanylate cyclase (GGDEF)-like protein
VVADDDPVGRRVLSRLLTRWGYAVSAFEDGTQALAALSGADAPRIAIVDWVMPGLDGPDLCRELRRSQRDSYLYLMLLTSRDSRQDLLEGLTAGADDYIVKPIDPPQVELRLRTATRILEMEDRLEAANRALREQVIHDPLTGVLTRGAVFDALDREVRSWRRNPDPSVCLMIIDIDRFKEVNDVHGHLVGDVVLKNVARAMTESVRPSDVVGRFGGDEFVIVLPHTDLARAEAVANRLIAAVRDCSAVTEGAPPTTISVGLAEAREDMSVEQVVDAADQALLEAKSNGRDRIQVSGA